MHCSIQQCTKALQHSPRLLPPFQVAQGNQFRFPEICSATRVKLQEGLQHNTQRVYQGEQRVFQTFCRQYNLRAFPASEDTLMLYVTYLDDHLKRHCTTIQHHLAAICSVHIVLGMKNPLDNCPRLHQLLWATRRQQPLPQLDSGRQGITSSFLSRARPLHSALTLTGTRSYGQPSPWGITAYFAAGSWHNPS